MRVSPVPLRGDAGDAERDTARIRATMTWFAKTCQLTPRLTDALSVRSSPSSCLGPIIEQSGAFRILASNRGRIRPSASKIMSREALGALVRPVRRVSMPTFYAASASGSGSSSSPSHLATTAAATELPTTLVALRPMSSR